MSHSELESQLHELSNVFVSELISLTPETMSEIQFEFVSTADGGADISLLENHPAVKGVALSDEIYDAASSYLPLIKQYVAGWKRSLFVLRLDGDEWQVEVNFEST